MISDFEARLATVLGAELPAPFGGVVAVGGGSDTAHENQPRLYVGAYRTEVKPQGFGGNRTIAVPEVEDLVRVVAMKVLVNISVLAASSADRVQQLQGIEQVQYLLDHERFQTGAALVDNGDQGFLIERMQVRDAWIDVTNAPLEGRAAGITLEAEGVFWPIGVAGEAGVAIDEIRLRGLVIDLKQGVTLPDISAGGSPLVLQLHLEGLASQRLGGDGSSLPFSHLALDLRQADGSPGAGSISGDSAGAGGVQFVVITDSLVSFTYTPPGSPAQDVLLVGFDDGENGLGQVVNRFNLISR